MSLDVSHICECLMRVLWNRVVIGIALNRFKDPTAFIKELFKMIYPPDQLLSNYTYENDVKL